MSELAAAATATASWRHVEFDGPTPPWTLRSIDGKGLAAFATRRFEEGELICTERPTVWIPGHHPFSPQHVHEIDLRVAALAEEDREAFFAMANVFSSLPDAPDAPDLKAPSEAAGIFMTNSFDMTDSPHGEACAMYVALARLNHSCTPNAQQTHIPETGEEVLHASRVIEAGEEINDCYIELRQGTKERRAALKEIYRFDCECHACGPLFPGEESTGCSDEKANGAVDKSKELVLREEARARDDARRARAFELDSQILSTASTAGPEAALLLALEALALLTRPECMNWSARYIADAHNTVYQLARASDRHEMAEEQAREAYRVNCLLQGPRSPVSLSLKKKLRSV